MVHFVVDMQEPVSTPPVAPEPSQNAPTQGTHLVVDVCAIFPVTAQFVDEVENRKMTQILHLGTTTMSRRCSSPNVLSLKLISYATVGKV
jgi:hypothetical protein